MGIKKKKKALWKIKTKNTIRIRNRQLKFLRLIMRKEGWRIRHSYRTRVTTMNLLDLCKWVAKTGARCLNKSTRIT